MHFHVDNLDMNSMPRSFVCSWKAWKWRFTLQRMLLLNCFSRNKRKRVVASSILFKKCSTGQRDELERKFFWSFTTRKNWCHNWVSLGSFNYFLILIEPLKGFFGFIGSLGESQRRLPSLNLSKRALVTSRRKKVFRVIRHKKRALTNLMSMTTANSRFYWMNQIQKAYVT